MGFAWTIVALIAVMAIAWRFLGAYMAAVFGGRVTWLRFAERPVYRMLGVDPDAEQSWQRYGVSLIHLLRRRPRRDLRHLPAAGTICPSTRSTFPA